VATATKISSWKTNTEIQQHKNNRREPTTTRHIPKHPGTRSKGFPSRSASAELVIFNTVILVMRMFYFKLKCTVCVTSALVGGEWSASRPGRFTPGTHCIGGWVDSRAGLDNIEKWKLLTLPELEPRPLSRPARSQSPYRLRYPCSRQLCIRQDYVTMAYTGLNMLWTEQ
jgi:hypothetical protein